MIIGKNNNNKNTQPAFTSNFNERFNAIVKEAEKNKKNISPFAETSSTKHYSNVNSKKEMADKSFAMLQERYSKGLISLEEFNKKCHIINKRRQK